MAKPNVIPPVLTAQEKSYFWSRFERPEPPGSECWIWTGTYRRNGYGYFEKQDRKYLAHRVSYFLHYGIWPGKDCVLHECDNRACGNPSHLALGSYAENIADMVSKNRQAKGERSPSRLHPESYPRGQKHHMTTLSESQVQNLREQANKGTPKKELALRFGIGLSTVYAICSKRSWKHIS